MTIDKKELVKNSEKEKLSPAIGAESDNIFDMLEPMSFEEYKETLPFLKKIFAQQKYNKYKSQIDQKNQILQENKELYESIKTEMSEKVRQAGSQEDWFVHDAMLLDRIKKDMQEVREEQQNFVTTFFNKQFMNAIQKLYTIVITLGPDHPLNKLFHKHLGDFIKEDEEKVDKIDLVKNLLAMEDQLRDSEEVADNLYWKLFEETSNAYKELETEQEALEKNAQKFKDEIEQLQQQLTEATETFEELTSPEEVYRKLEEEILEEINDTTEKQSTTNFMLNVLREANQKYTKKYNGLEKRIEQLEEDGDTAVEEYGEFLTEEYELYIQDHTQSINQLDTTHLKEVSSVEELDGIYKGMRKRLYSNKVYDDLINEYKDLFGTSLEVVSLEEYEKLQEEKDLELQSACHEWLQDNMWKEREEKLAKVDDTIVELQRKKVAEVLQVKVQEYTKKVNSLQEQREQYTLLVKELTEQFIGIPTGVKGNMQRNIPGYFDEETQLFEIINSWDSSVDALMEEKATLEETILHYKGLLHEEQREELQKGLDIDDSFEYINWQELYDSFEDAGIGKDAPLRKYFLLQNSTDYVVTDKNIVVFTSDGNIVIFSQDNDVIDILRDKQGDYTQVADAEMQLLLDEDGTQDDVTFNKLITLADNAEYTKKIRKMIDHIGEKRSQKLISDKPDEISPLSISLGDGIEKYPSTEHERKQFLEETYQDIYKDNLLQSGYVLLATQYDQKEFRTVNGLVVVERGEKLGFINKEGELVGEGCIFDEILDSRNGMRKVRRGEKYGFIDKEGELIGEGCVYDEVWGVDKGKWIVRKGNKWGYVNMQGELVGEGGILSLLNLSHSLRERLTKDYRGATEEEKQTMVDQAKAITLIEESKEKGNTVKISGKTFSFLRPEPNGIDVFAGEKGEKNGKRYDYEHVRYIKGCAMEKYLGDQQMFAGQVDFEEFIENNIPGISKKSKLQNFADLMSLEFSGSGGFDGGFFVLGTFGIAWISRPCGHFGEPYNLVVRLNDDAYTNSILNGYAYPVIVFSD